MQLGIRGNAGKHHKIFLDNKYIVYLCPLPRLDVQWSFKRHKITKYQQLQKKINPKQKTNEHLWSHPSSTKKQTEIIPVRCNYDRTIAKFLLPLEIDLDSSPCILRDTMRHNCHRPPSVVRFCPLWMPQHNRCRRFLQQMVMHDASCNLWCFLPFVSIFFYLFVVSLDALPLLFFVIFPPGT